VGNCQGVFAGAEILENCPEFKHRLAARGLPPGANAWAMIPHGCEGRH